WPSSPGSRDIACASRRVRGDSRPAFRPAPQTVRHRMSTGWTLSADRCFDSDPTQRSLARELYASIADLRLICPHGHVDPWLLAEPDARFPSPADLFIIPDHYVFRMLFGQGVRMEDLGVPTRDGTPVEMDGRAIC